MSSFWNNIDDNETNEATENEVMTEQTEEMETEAFENENTEIVEVEPEEEETSKPKRKRSKRTPVPPVDPEVGRQIVNLWSQMSAEEIAQKFDVTVEQVKRTKANIVSNLKNRLKKAQTEGDEGTIAKIEKVLEEKFPPKPRGAAGGHVGRGPSPISSVVNDLLADM